MSKSPYTIRPVKVEDESFIYNSWLKSFRGAHFSGPLPSDLYFDAYRQLLDRVLESDSTTVLVCHNPENEDQIFGYIVVGELGENQPVVHYIYVKDPFRRMGIMKALVERAGVERVERFYYTFRTGICKKLVGPTGPFPYAQFKPSLASRYNNGPDQTGKVH